MIIQYFTWVGADGAHHGVPLALVALIVLAALADVDVLRQAVRLPAQKNDRLDRGWVWFAAGSNRDRDADFTQRKSSARSDCTES